MLSLIENSCHMSKRMEFFPSMRPRREPKNVKDLEKKRIMFSFSFGNTFFAFHNIKV